MLRALFDCGLQPTNTHILGKCYSTNHNVMKELESDGVHILSESTYYNPHRPYDDVIDEHIHKLTSIAHQAANSKRFVIALDSGGHLLKELNQREDIATDTLVGIEQTSSGFHAMKDKALRFPILNVARSSIKLNIESPWIADSVVVSLLYKMRWLPKEWQRFKYDTIHPERLITAKRAAGVQLGWKDRFYELMQVIRPPRKKTKSIDTWRRSYR